jgi:hypothetical protein
VSDPGVGSVFTLHLPVAAGSKVQTATALQTERVSQK